MSNYPKNAITGIILAGGRAERMGGQDKGLLPLAGRPMASYAIARLQPQVGTLIINANRHLDQYQALGYPVVSDTVGDFFGPLAGMLAAMETAETEYLISVPCDSPLLSNHYVQRMYTALQEQQADLSVAHNGERLQPVFALLKTALRADLRQYLQSGERKIDRWFAKHQMAIVDLSDQPAMFRNINTPQELALLEDEIR